MMTHRRPAVTLLELLVVIAIITLLILILLPAVNAVREMGRRTQCVNNQRNLVVALINYESMQGAFPAAVPLCDARVYNSLGRETGISCMGPNWVGQIFGQIEEDNRYEQLVLCVRSHWHAADDCGAPPIRLAAVTPNFLICPSAETPRKLHGSMRTKLDHLSKGNYAACLGAEHYRTAIEEPRHVRRDNDDRFQIGVMAMRLIPDYENLTDLTLRGQIPGNWRLGHGIGTSVAKVKDGTSQTIILSEVLAWDGPSNDVASPDIRGVWFSASMGASTYTHKYGPNSPMPDRINGCDPSISRESLLHCETAPANGADSAETWASARSSHRGGVVATLADGSVRFFADDIHLPIWQAFATRAGLER